MLAEEREQVGRLLSAVSESLNRDLPARLGEVVRAELAASAAGLAAAVAPAVQKAVAASLPKEVSGAVKASVDKALPAALAAGLAKPVAEGFRASFSKQLVPAFEGACQSMFLQINNAFTQGLDEHLQVGVGVRGGEGAEWGAARGRAEISVVESILCWSCCCCL